jgi:hypothetical protein
MCPESQDAQPEEISYWQESRQLSTGLLLVLPLIAVYHFGILQSGSQFRNVAELWVSGPLRWMGLPAAQILNIAVIVGFLVALGKLDRRGGAMSLLILAVMVAESALYAAIMFRCVGLVTEAIRVKVMALLSASTTDWTALSLAVGAGVYEELLFRLILIGGGSLLLRKVFLWNRPWSFGVMLVLSSVAFSAMHYVGSCGDTLELYSFLFRVVAGMTLGTIYLLRGWGIAAWSHALYNVSVHLLA